MNTLGTLLPEEHRVVRLVADHKASDIPLWDVLREPSSDLLLPVRREQRRQSGRWDRVARLVGERHGTRRCRSHSLGAGQGEEGESGTLVGGLVSLPLSISLSANPLLLVRVSSFVF